MSLLYGIDEECNQDTCNNIVKETISTSLKFFVAYHWFNFSTWNKDSQSFGNASLLSSLSFPVHASFEIVLILQNWVLSSLPCCVIASLLEYCLLC